MKKAALLLICLISPAIFSPHSLRADDTRYYDDLRETCIDSACDGWTAPVDGEVRGYRAPALLCCLGSVDSMESMGYREAEGRKCPEGLELNQIHCPNSKAWCQPIK